MRDRWLPFLPPLLLAAVGAVQIGLTHVAALSPWSGGGFGMFSTTDAGGNRYLHAYALYPGLRVDLDLGPRNKDAVQRALAFPAKTRLRQLAQTLAEVPDPHFGRPNAVGILVFRTRFDPETLAPRGELLRSLEVRFGPDAPD